MIPYQSLTHDQLLSAITERDEQLRNCMDKLHDTLKESVSKKDYTEQQEQFRMALGEIKLFQHTDRHNAETYKVIVAELNETKSQLHASQEKCKELQAEVAKVNGFRDDLQSKYQTLRDKYSEACSHLESSQERCKELADLIIECTSSIRGSDDELGLRLVEKIEATLK